MGRGLVVWGLVLAAVVTGAFTRPGRAATAREDHMRAEIAQLLNGERANRGLSQLAVDADLAASAQAWAEQMRASNCQPPTNCHSPGNDAEILAWGVAESKTGAIVVAWMQSTTHRDILLHPRADTLGVGFACSEDGTVFTAVQFGGAFKPAPSTSEDPIASENDQGSACVGPAAYLAQTAPPSTAPAATSPPSTAPPATEPPRRGEPATVIVRRTPPTTTAAATTVAVTAAPTTTTTSPPVVLSAGSTSVTANLGDPDALATEPLALPPPHKAESAWLFMIVVVVFLSVIRVGFQLRDAAGARSKDSVRGVGL